VYALFLASSGPPQGLMGKDVIAAPALAVGVLALVIAYPLVLSTPFQQRLGALVLLLCDRGIGLDIIRRLCRPGIVGGHVVSSVVAPTPQDGAYAISGLSPLIGIPAASS